MSERIFCIAAGSHKQLAAEILSIAGILIYSPQEYSADGLDSFLAAVSRMGTGKTRVFLDLPAAAMSEDIKLLREILNSFKGSLAGVCANNVYGLRLADEYGLDAFKGMGLNTLNDNFCDFKNILLSPELNENDYRLFKDWDKKNYFLCVFGRLPLMLLSHCPYQVNGYDCKSCGGVKLQYKDETGNVMDIRRVKMASCYFELLNAVPLNLLKYKNKIKPHYYFDVRGYGAETILRTLTAFKEPGNKEPEGKYTTGLYFK